MLDNNTIKKSRESNEFHNTVGSKKPDNLDYQRKRQGGKLYTPNGNAVYGWEQGNKSLERLKQLEDHMNPPDSKKEKEKLSLPDISKIYKTAFLGASPDIAYYLESAKDKIDPRTSIIIGETRLWVGDNGSPHLTSSILHPEYAITPELESLGPTPNNNKLVKREDFSRLIENVIERSGMMRKKEQVMKVEKVEQGYKITYGNKGNEQVIYAEQVVMGKGARYTPGGIDEGQIARNVDEAMTKKIMNSTTFAKVYDKLGMHSKMGKKTEVIILGEKPLEGANYLALGTGYRIKFIGPKEGLHFYYPYSLPKKAVIKILKDQYPEKWIPKELRNAINQLDPTRPDSASVAEKINARELLGKHLPAESVGLVGEIEKGPIDLDHGVLPVYDVYNSFLENANETESGVTVTLRDGQVITGDYLVFGDESRATDVIDDSLRQSVVPIVKDGNVVWSGTQDGSLKILNSSGSLSEMRARILEGNDFMPSKIDKNANFSFYSFRMLTRHFSSKYPDIAQRKLSEAEKAKEPALAKFTYLGDALAQRIVDSRNHNRKFYENKPDGLLPSGPPGQKVTIQKEEGGIEEYWNGIVVTQEGGRFQQYWEKEIVALNDHIKAENERAKAKDLQELADAVSKLYEFKSKL